MGVGTGTVLALALVASGCAPRSSPVPDTPPDFLVIVLDDLGVDKVGVYGPSSALTPTLDDLAARGLLFRRFYTNEMCSPSRASLMTGLQPYDHGINTHLYPWDTNSLSTDLTTLPDALDGYSTRAIGKWHLGGRKDSAPDPSQAVAHGFGSYTGNPDNFGWRDGAWDGQDESYTHYEALDEGPLYGPAWSVHDGYATTSEVDAALLATRTLSEPWLIWLGLHAPHVPNHVPPGSLNPRGVTSDATETEMYDAMVEAADAEIGRLLDRIDPDVLARTTIFVLGDNGSPIGVVDQIPPSPRGKNSPYESGIHTPLIVAGAGVTRGAEVDALVSHTDLFATLVDLADADAPVPEESRSFAPLLADPAAPGRDTVYVEMHEYQGDVDYRDDRIVVGPRYKLVRQLDGDHLYDLQADPGELVNLLDQPLAPEVEPVLEALRTELARQVSRR